MKHNIHPKKQVAARIAGMTAFLLLLSSAWCGAQQVNSKYSTSPFAEKEVLRYSVHWTFVKLGTIELRQKMYSYKGGTRNKLQLIARTASGVPFINLDVRDISYLTPEDPRCMDFTVEKSDDVESKKRYIYDPARETFTLLHTEGNKKEDRKVRQEPRRCYDPLGFLMYMRGLAGSGVRETVPTLLDYEIVDTRIVCHREVEEMDVDAFEDDVRTRRVSLRAGWEDESVGGMQGDIELWFLEGPASIPVFAEMDLALGSIKIELQSCKRTDANDGKLQARLTGTANKGGAQ